MMNPRCRYNPEYLNGIVAFESNGEGPQKPLAQGKGPSINYVITSEGGGTVFEGCVISDIQTLLKTKSKWPKSLHKSSKF